MSDSGDTEAEGSSTTNLAESDKSESKKKIIRLLTVMAYVSSVSGTAFMLSMYYLFLWEPKVAEHHLQASPNSHQALALQGHGREPALRSPWPAGPLPGPLPGALDPWPPGPRDANSFAAHRPLAKFDGYSQGPYQSLPPLAPVTAPDRRPQYPAYWESPVVPQSRRPPSLSLVREPATASGPPPPPPPLPILRQERHQPAPSVLPSNSQQLLTTRPTAATPKPITSNPAPSRNLAEPTKPPIEAPVPAPTRQYSAITATGAEGVSTNATSSPPNTSGESRGVGVESGRLPESSSRPSSSPASPVTVDAKPPTPTSTATPTPPTSPTTANSTKAARRDAGGSTSLPALAAKDVPAVPADPTKQPTTATPTSPTTARAA